MKVQLGSLYKISSGGTPLKNKKEYYDDGDINWVKTGDLKQQYLYDTQDCITQIGLEKSSAKMYEANTVLVAMYGATIGATSILKIPACTNQACAAFPRIDKVIPEYLYYFLKSKKSKFVNDGVGGAQPNISGSYLKKVDFNLLDLDEQKKIVDLLDKTARIIDYKKEQIMLLDNLIKSRFVEMFGDGNYANQTLIEIIKEGAGLSYGIVVPGENVNNGIPMIRPSDFKNGNLILDSVYIVDYEIEKKYRKTRLEGNEILVQVIGQPGQVMLTNEDCAGMNVTRNLAVIRHDDRIVNKFYLKEFLLTIEAQTSMLGGTNQSTLMQLPLGTLKKLKVPLPPLKLQNQFADFVQQVVKLKVEVQKSMHETQVLFDSLMQEYFE